MIVAIDTVVLISYRLQVDDGSSGMRFYEEVSPEEPFALLYGRQGTIPKLEAALEGLKEGDSFSVFIGYEEGYGDYDETRRAILPKARFKLDGKKEPEILKVGMVIPMQDDTGNKIPGEITKIDYLGVHMDFNPPLAGYDLLFEGKVEGIREATASEREHGHAHGPGGHQHE